ncbi:MAG: hypothetical protein HDT26_00395 [Subdoligranulum sp.]|nr:hypothetical protein [Subdoligranulum sp.]
MPKKTKTVTIRQPAYYKEFSCIGPACTDNCCHDWMVTIDKKHYLQYMGVADHAFHEKCKKAILRNKKCKGTGDYAVMQLDSGRCIFQDPDGGCGIFRKLGEDALSDTCTIYPRRQVRMDEDHWERSLSLSCQEAARLALLTGKPLEFEEITYAIDPNDRLASSPGKLSWAKDAPHREELLAVRETCLEIIGQHHRPLTERILAIGLALRTVERYAQEGNYARISLLLKEYTAQSASGTLLQGFFERLPEDPATVRWAMLLPAKHLMSTERKLERLEMFETVGPYCEMEEDKKAAVGPKALDFITERAREIGDPFISRHAQAVENYFSNYIFSMFFPFTYQKDGCTLSYHAVMLAEQYAMLRILLGVMPQREGEDEEQRLIRLVAILAHITQHRNLGLDVQNFAKQRENLDTLAYTAYMLR